jgi:hypothetical protein
MANLSAMERPIKRRCLKGHERRMPIIRQPSTLFERVLLFIVAYYKYEPIAQKIKILPYDLQEQINASLNALQAYDSKKYNRLPIG